MVKSMFLVIIRHEAVGLLHAAVWGNFQIWLYVEVQRQNKIDVTRASCLFSSQVFVDSWVTLPH